MISVAIPPGGDVAAATASAASPASALPSSQVRTQSETGRETPSMSEVSGASSPRCQVACSPMMLTIGVCARRALWKLAKALPMPGPRCSRVAAGTPRMRP